jgi:hypothetical protein
MIARLFLANVSGKYLNSRDAAYYTTNDDNAKEAQIVNVQTSGSLPKD